MKKKAGKRIVALLLGLSLVVASGMMYTNDMSAVNAEGSATVTEDIFDGKTEQWAAVESNQANPAPNLQQIKAVSDGTYLYGYVAAESIGDTLEVYISAEGLEGADMSGTWVNATSVAYKLDVTGTLYKYDGSQWADTGVKATVYKEEAAMEFAVEIAALTETGTEFGVAVMESEESILPSAGKDMLQVYAPIMEEIPAITADGDPADWEGIEPIAEGEGAMGDLYAVKDNDYLYVMSYVKNVDESNFQGFSTNLYINTDTKGSTGYQHSKYGAMNGAEFLVQDWCSIAVDGGEYSPNTEYFYHEAADNSWAWDVQESGVDFKQSAPTSEAGVYCIEFKVPIEALKKATSKISDDLYIAIDRDWIEGNADEAVNLPLGYVPAADEVNGSYVRVPKYQTTLGVSAEDSSLNDWLFIPNAAGNSSEDTMYNMFATRSQELLYVLVTSAKGDFTTDNTFYLDTDSSAGYAVDTYTGVDYVIKDARLYKADGDNTLSEEICSVNMEYFAESIEMQVYLEEMDNPESISIAYAGKGYDGRTYDDTTVPNKEMILPLDGSYFEVTTSFTMDKAEGLYYPKESFDSFTNPYIGWAGWANSYGMGSESAYDYDLAYVGIKWREFEPEEGKYDFEAIDEIYHISQLVADGKRINLRFIMDNPDSYATTKCMDIPQWLYDQLVEENGEEGAGTYYYREDQPGGIAGSIGSGFSPNYYSELLLKYHEKAIKALAEKFDDPNVVGYVQVGSIGHWAEFHTWPEGTGVFPNPEVATKYMEPYTKYFKNVKVGIRKPFPYAAEHGFGLFNDIFGVSEYAGTPAFLKYIESGCTDMGPGATAEDIVNSKMPDFWKTNYSGGEFASGNVRLHLTDPGTVGCLQQVRDSHTSWLGPCSVTGITVADADAAEYQKNVEAMQKLMGYRFSLRSVTKVDAVNAGDKLSLDMVWENDGVAPLYYNWPMELSLIAENGEVAYSELIDVNITDWLPGTNMETVKFAVPSKFAAGNYTIAVAVADPDTKVPGVKLAIEGGRDDLRYPLYQLTVNASNGSGAVVWIVIAAVVVVAAIVVVIIGKKKRNSTK